MQVQMINIHTPIRTIIEHQAVTGVGNAFHLRHSVGRLEHLGEDVVIVSAPIADVFDVLVGNDEDVDRRLGVDVAKGGGVGAVVDNLGGDVTADDFAEDAVAHSWNLTCAGM